MVLNYTNYESQSHAYSCMLTWQSGRSKLVTVLVFDKRLVYTELELWNNPDPIEVNKILLR